MVQPVEPRRPAESGDWASQAADTIESVVGAVRDRTATPLTTIARALVYGLLAAVLGVVSLVLLAVAAVRALNSYLPGDVWAAHLVVGLLFMLAGLLLWGKRRPRGVA